MREMECNLAYLEKPDGSVTLSHGKNLAEFTSKTSICIMLLEFLHVIFLKIKSVNC